MENIQASKSQLAKLLAIENITVQHQAGARTAWFDVKNRILSLPVWRDMSNDLYDMLVVHEVGHALDTPADGWEKAIKDIAKRLSGNESRIKGFLNVIEDARIDKRQKRRFPGAKRNYIAAYKDLIERDFFGTARRDVNTLPFIDRMNMYFKGGALHGVKFSPEEMPMLRAVEEAETFAEVVALTEKIYQWSKDKKQEEQQIKDMHQFADDEEGDDESFGRGSPDDDDGEGMDFEDDDNEADDTDGEGSGKAKNSDGDDAGNSTSSNDIDDKGDASNGDDDGEPESLTDKAWEEKQKELVQDSDTEYVYVSLPTIDKSKVVDDYKTVLAEQAIYQREDRGNFYGQFNSFKAEENATISYMVKEFEMRKSADEFQRTSIAKTGVIDTNKLHSYKYNEDIFRRMSTVAAGKNHGFVMFLDWSGSMTHNLRGTIKQVLSLAWFCKRIQVPFEVYAFRTPNERETYQMDTAISRNAGELRVHPFKLRNFLSSRMKLQELNDAMLNLWMSANNRWPSCDFLNSTPLNQAIMVAPDIVNEFKARNKLQVVNTIFLTDGDSDPITYVYKANDKGIASHDDSMKKKYIIQDKKTKKSYDLKMNSRYNTSFDDTDRKMLTITLLKMLKDQTGCNLIGFYLHGSNFRYAYEQFFGYNSAMEHNTSMKKMWSDDGFIPVTTEGYDEYYVLNTKNMDITTEELKVDNTMTKGKLAKEFMKFSSKKSLNRVLLQRFVKKIAA